MTQQNILIFGTSADPIHSGHTVLLESCVRALTERGIDLQQVLIIPVYRRNPIDAPQKNDLPSTFEMRFQLCQLTAQGIRQRLHDLPIRVETSRLEQELGKSNHRPNYTIETLEALKINYGPTARFFLLLGSDAFSGDTPTFEKWYRMQDIIASASLVICPRRGYLPNQIFLQELKQQGARIIYLDEIYLPEISSSEIRQRIVSGEDINHLVEEKILDQNAAHFIAQSQLVEHWRLAELNPENDTQRRECMKNLEVEIGQILTGKGLTLALAESCTGGLLGHRITNVPGSSVYFLGGVVAYAYEAKVKLLGVSWDTLKQFGAVSSETVIEMAVGIRHALSADIGLSVCCIAGPGGATPTKPVGTGWVALSTDSGNWSKHYLFEFNRIGNKEAIAESALSLLYEYLKGI